MYILVGTDFLVFIINNNPVKRPLKVVPVILYEAKWKNLYNACQFTAAQIYRYREHQNTEKAS